MRMRLERESARRAMALLLVVAGAAAALFLLTGDAAASTAPAATDAPGSCANGVVVPQPAANPELVADCRVLLDLQPDLAGTATLNWGANTALSSWDGITVASLDGIQRVTELDMDGQGLNGTIPAQLGELTGLRELRLAWGNQLTGSIPPQLGRLTRLTFLNLAANHLSGSIPPELGSIGPQLTHLVLSAPQPLPNGVGLTGSIPAQLGNLSGLTSLYLDGNRLTGSIPPRLGRLLKLSWLHLTRNQLTGAIPTQLGALTNLTNLRLEDNRLSGPIPSQLNRLTNLRKVYLTRNAGFSGCVPPRLREVRFNDIATLNLPDCASDAPETPETPLPAYTLTVTAGEGGAVDPAGISTHTEAVPVILTASWNDATHTFVSWSGDCAGSATTCMLELYADASVTATFSELPSDRCAQAGDADCIRAVYLGAPEDYAQVQDIPAELLLTPNADGRYVVERGQQVTVVTAAPLPVDWTRFYLQQDPLERPWAVSFSQLIPPIGTTYTFTPSDDPAAADLLTFDLYAARPWPFQRPGLKPELGDLIVTTAFQIPVPPLALELTSSRDLCTANTLTELSWTIIGGKPPYTLTIDGQQVDPEADSHRVNCGSLMIDPQTEEPLPDQIKTFTGMVMDSQTTPETMNQQIRVNVVEPLPAPTNLSVATDKRRASMNWDAVQEEGLRDADGDTWPFYLLRWRAADDMEWEHVINPVRRPTRMRIFGQRADLVPGGRYEYAVAALRDPIETETPAAALWSTIHAFTTAVDPQNVNATATHDTITVTWDGQDAVRQDEHLAYYVDVDSNRGARTVSHYRPPAGQEPSVTIPALEPDTSYRISVTLPGALDYRENPIEVRTKPAPDDWQPLLRGAQNVRATPTHNSVTVQWEAPYPEANDVYIVYLFDTRYPNDQAVRPGWVGNGQTSHTFTGLPAGTSYRVVVIHVDVVKRHSVAFVTTNSETGSTTDSGPRSAGTLPDESTLPAPEGMGLGLAPASAPILFDWPLAMNEHYRMTTDVWVWRDWTSPNAFHHGLDIGHVSGGEAIRGDPVFASAPGVLRVFGDDPAERRLILYCPDIEAVFFRKFVTADEKQGICGPMIYSGSGRSAVVFHGQAGIGPYVSRYIHLESISPVVAQRLGNDWREVESKPRTWFCGVTPDQLLESMEYCPYHEDRFILTSLDPENVLPPPPPATRFTFAGHPADQVFDPAIMSGVPQEQSFEVDNVYKRFLVAGIMPGPSGSLTVEFDAAAWRPLAYTYYESGMPERFQQPGVEGTSDGVIGYVVRSDCQASAASPPLSPTAYAQDRFWSEVLPVRIPASVGLGDRCAFWLATYNETFPASASLPVGAYGRNADKSSFIPERLSAVVEVHAGRLSPGTAVEIADELWGIQFKVYEFVAVAGRAPRFETVLVGTHPIPDIVLEVWNSTGRVAHKAHPIAGPVILDNWTPAASGRHFLVARGGYVAA